MAGWFPVPAWEGDASSNTQSVAAVAKNGPPSKAPHKKKHVNKPKNTKTSAVQSKPEPSSSAPAGQFVRAPVNVEPAKAALKRKLNPPASSDKKKKADAKQNPAKKRKLEVKAKPKQSNEKVTKQKKSDETAPSKPNQPKQNKLKPGAAKKPDANPFHKDSKLAKTPKKKPAKPAKKLELAAEESDSELAAEVNSFRKKLLKGFSGPREIGGKPDPNAKFSDDDDDFELSESDDDDAPRKKKRTKQTVAEPAKKPTATKKNAVPEPSAEDDAEPEAEVAPANTSFRDKLIGNLKGSRFRFINEQLYTSDGSSAVKLFKADRAAFSAYHEGYRQQVTQWPLNPLDRIIKSIKKLPKTSVIADFGCGEGRLAKAVPNKTYSLDLVAQRHEIIACDMAKTPLETGTIDVAVYCLSLMGTNLRDFILEANRVLRIGGQLKIAEVESRFEDVRAFVDNIKACGFQHINTDTSSKFFVFLNFKKVHSTDKSNKQVPTFSLKPCLYKKR